MKTKYYILIIALVVLFAFTFFNFYNMRGSYEKKETQYVERIKDLETKKNYFDAENLLNFNATYKYGNTQINSDIELYKGKNETYLLKEIIKGPKLVYRISDNVCELCYDQVLVELIEFNSKMDENNIIVLVPLEKIRELKVYLAHENVNIPFYGIKKGALGLEVNKYYPFFFLIDNSFANQIFVPSKNQVESTRNYLDIIKSRYFSNNKVSL